MDHTLKWKLGHIFLRMRRQWAVGVFNFLLVWASALIPSIREKQKKEASISGARSARCTILNLPPTVRAISTTTVNTLLSEGKSFGRTVFIAEVQFHRWLDVKINDQLNTCGSGWGLEHHHHVPDKLKIIFTNTNWRQLLWKTVFVAEVQFYRWWMWRKMTRWTPVVQGEVKRPIIMSETSPRSTEGKSFGKLFIAQEQFHTCIKMMWRIRYVENHIPIFL